MNVFVVTHIQPTFILPEGYQYIGVGPGQLDILFHDSSGDNIAHKNSYYCELTAIYWIWKNYSCPPDSYIGLVHYRRALVNNSWLDILRKKCLTDLNVSKLLTNSDIILPNKVSFSNSLYAQYGDAHDSSDLDIVLDYIQFKNPQAGHLVNKFMNLNSGYIYNIFITRKDIFDQYCEWLFDILFSVEHLIRPMEKHGYQRRVMGFLAERLINLWLMMHPNIKITEKRILRTDKSGLSNLNRLRRGAV